MWIQRLDQDRLLPKLVRRLSAHVTCQEHNIAEPVRVTMQEGGAPEPPHLLPSSLSDKLLPHTDHTDQEHKCVSCPSNGLLELHLNLVGQTSSCLMVEPQFPSSKRTHHSETSLVQDQIVPASSLKVAFLACFLLPTPPQINSH